MTDLKHVLSIDPGKSSGLALGSYSDTQPYTLVKCWQVSGGPEGLHDWLERHRFDDDVAGGLSFARSLGNWYAGIEMEVCYEKFTPLQNKGFAQTLDSTTPLVCEGVLMSLGIVPWYPGGNPQRPNEMYRYGGKDKKEKLKLARKFLKDHDMLPTGKTVGQKDAHDSISAILHGIAFLVKQKHGPTMKMILEWSNNG